MGMMINRRRVCGGKSLPYDYEVEWFDCDGKEYITTSLVPYDRNVAFEMRVLLKTSSDQTTGSFYGYYVKMFNFCKNHIEASISTSNNYNNTAAFDYNTVFDCRGEYGYENKLKVYKDGVLKFSIDIPSFSISGSFIFLLDVGTRRGWVYRGRIYYYRLWFDDTLVLDFIPVVKDGVGYMYDKVSGQLFGNQGTGSFIVGPRVS